MSSPLSESGNGTDRVACVGGLVHDKAGRLLLVLRANEPGAGLWSVPGGRVEPGESDAAALVREVREETGLEVAVGELAGRVQVGAYDIADYHCSLVGGVLEPGDDAVAARWAAPEDLPRLQLVDGLREFLSRSAER